MNLIDVSFSVGPGYATRSLAGIVGIGIHHCTAPNMTVHEMDTIAEEEAHIKALDAYHQQQFDAGGFGYSAAIFPSGRAYSMGPLTQVRAGIAKRNYEIASFVLMGNFMTERPTSEAIASARELVVVWRRQLGRQAPVKGHREWALSGYGTACPGDTWQEWIPELEEQVPDETEELWLRITHLEEELKNLQNYVDWLARGIIRIAEELVVPNQRPMATLREMANAYQAWFGDWRPD